MVRADEPPTRPNIIFFLADDLGYADLGCFGQTKTRTPHLDRLAAAGVRLTQHYSGNAVCAPSRCVFMTGMHPGHAFVRNNRSVGPEGQYPLYAGAVTVAELLKQQGYATGAFGKWGLGPPASEGAPLQQGFDRFYGYNCQAVAHNHYPTYLWDNDRRQPLDNPPFAAHQPLPADAALDDPASYTRYAGRQYAPDLMADEALKFVRDNQSRPFFLYVPTTIPHVSLQVPDDSLAEYRGQLDDAPYDGHRRYLPHHDPHAAYAAMITRMDGVVGGIMDLVEELGLTEQTLFVFSSDNGPAAERVGGSDSEFFASAGPLRGLKGSLYEGGIRVPGIVYWKDHIEPAVCDRVTGFEDWLPTFLELAGAGEAIPAEIDGISFAATLLGEEQPPREFLYREFTAGSGQQSVRVGDWKGIRPHIERKGRRGQPDLHIELYDLATDVGEKRDVSADHPEVVAKIEKLMRDQHTPSDEFPLPGIDAP
ncbi:MAG: arylsulfatase [Pirellulales bacterium]